MPAAEIRTETDPWYDVQNGVIRDRRIFTDPDIYQEELVRIFGRAWNFMCHESQLPEPGSFFMNRIGEDDVVAVRDREGGIQVLLNSCPHRGNSVCRAEFGKTNGFFCSYHGWNFDLQGRLVGMPGEKELYRGGIDKTQWGLRKAAQVESYHGFVFATLDPTAPPLEEYLGWVGRLGIDMLATRGDMEVLDGVQKNVIKCNWKLAVDNLYDWYHVGVTHGTALRIGLIPDAPDRQLVMLGEYGHGIGGPGFSDGDQASIDAMAGDGPNGGSAQFELTKQWYDTVARNREAPEVRERLGPMGRRSYGHPNIFPNLWITVSSQVCLRIPRGPLETELWWFTFVPKEAPEEERRMTIFMANHAFGPAGLLEQDDGENWSHSTRGAKGTYLRDQPLNLGMGKGRDEVSDDPSGQSGIETVVNEHGQRWTYQSWQDWMRASSWQELMANHAMPPSGAV